MLLKQLAVAAVLCTGFAAQAQIALSQGFGNVSGLAGAGWSFLNTSPSPGTSWFQGNPGVFSAAAGPDDSYAAANFLGTSATTGPISNWMVTPLLTLDATSTVSFSVRAAGANLLDRVDVLVSTSDTAPASFTQIGSYSSSTDEGWVQQTFGAGLAGTAPAYVAFRYVVADVANAGNYLGVDNLVITAVPEPVTTVLLGLGLAGLLARRRFSA